MMAGSLSKVPVFNENEPTTSVTNNSIPSALAETILQEPTIAPKVFFCISVDPSTKLFD